MFESSCESKVLTFNFFEQECSRRCYHGANYIKSVIIKGKRLISLLDLQRFVL